MLVKNIIYIYIYIYIIIIISQKYFWKDAFYFYAFSDAS